MKLHSCDICQEKFAVGTDFIKHIDTKHAQTIFVESETIKEEDIKEEIEESNAEDPLFFQEKEGGIEGKSLCSPHISLKIIITPNLQQVCLDFSFIRFLSY